MTFFLNNDDISSVLTMKETMHALDTAYRDLAAGTAVCRPRIDIRIPTDDPEKLYQWGTMEGGSSSSGYFAIRMKSDVTYEQEYGGTRTEEKYCMQPGLFCGLILLINIQNGEPLAFINDGYLQHMRVGADSAIGANYMARPDAQVVGMIGSGGMARSHAESLSHVRDIKRINVYSPTKANREHYAAEMSAKLGIEVNAVTSVEEALDGADIISCNTNAMTPVLFPEMVKPGVHITVVSGEWDRAVPRMVDVVPSSAESHLFHGAAPDFALGRGGAAAVYAAASDEDLQHLVDISGNRYGDIPARSDGGGDNAPRKTRSVPLADLIQGTAPGRLNDDEISSSAGVGGGGTSGMSFVVVGKLVYELARERGLGTEIPTNLFLQDVRN